jgi:hypothetical protein
MGIPEMKHLAGIMALTLLTLLAVVETSSRETDPPESRSQTFFARFVELAEAFDPAVADLYADEARIVSVRKYPNGAERTLEMRGVEYKSLIRSIIPLAKARRDTNTYIDISYQRQGSRVWIRATRYSALKQYSSPYALLVGPNPSGIWLIYEEHNVTRP